MKGAIFQVGDKVTVVPGAEGMALVPKLVRGRVYCVSGVFVEDGREVLGLVGQRGDRRGYFLGDHAPAHCFDLVHRSSQGDDARKEAS